MCYVVVLNSIIINMLYKRYRHLLVLKSSNPVPLQETSSEVHDMARNSSSMIPALEAQSTHIWHGTACERTMQLVVKITQTRNSLSNDITKQVSILTRLRGILKDKTLEHVNMFLAVDVNTFMPVHRTLCGNIPRCGLMITHANENAEIFQQMANEKPCVKDFVLIDDRADVDPSLFARLQHTSSERVTCLVNAPVDQPCPRVAFRIPRAFFAIHNTREVEIMSTAAIEGLVAPPYPAL